MDPFRKAQFCHLGLDLGEELSIPNHDENGLRKTSCDLRKGADHVMRRLGRDEAGSCDQDWAFQIACQFPAQGLSALGR